MARRFAMNQLLKFIQDEYGINFAQDIEFTLLDIFIGFIKRGLEVELDRYLQYSRYDFRIKSNSNIRIQYKNKIIYTLLGKNKNQGACEDYFGPRIVIKCETTVIGIEDKILDLYAKGLFTCDILKTLEEIYCFEVSHEMISNVIGSDCSDSIITTEDAFNINFNHVEEILKVERKKAINY